MYNFIIDSNKRYISLLVLIYFLYVLNLLFLYKGGYNSVEFYKCYLLNYDGGFVRRGLLGEIIKIIYNIFNLNLSNIFFFIFLFTYSFFFYLFYKLTKHLEKNIIFYFFILSPINFLYLLVQLNYELPVFLGSYEIFLITFFLYFSLLTINSNSRTKIYIIGIAGLFILTFLYEMTFFAYPFFILIYYNFLIKNKLKIKVFEIIFFLIVVGLIVYIHLSTYGNYDLNIFFKNIYFDYNILINTNERFCTYEWMNKKILNQITIFYSDFKISYIIKYFFYSHPILILLFYSLNTSKDKINNFLLTVAVFSLSILFVIATDWARFIHIIYLFSLFSIIIIFYIKNIDLLSLISKNNFIKNINKSFLFFFVILYCSIWTLKHTYWQNHLSYAIIKIIDYNFSSISKLLNDYN